MTKWPFLLIVSAWICGASFAEVWTLHDEQTGEVFGPLAPSNGARVSVDDRVLTLQVSQTKRDRTVAQLKELIIPTIEFRQANVADVLNFLVEASIAADPNKEGANVVWNKRRLEGGEEKKFPASGERLENRSDTGAEIDFREEPAPVLPADPEQTVTLNLRRVSLFEAVSIITEVAGLEWEITEGGVVLVREKKKPDPNAP